MPKQEAICLIRLYGKESAFNPYAIGNLSGKYHTYGIPQLKKVYRRGAGAFSSSHRPGMTRGGWAAARVNMFLRMMAGKSVKDSYRKADSDVARSSTSIDISDSWELEDIDFAQAEADIKEYDLNYDFENVEELYLDEEDNSNKFWYEL